MLEPVIEPLGVGFPAWEQAERVVLKVVFLKEQEVWYHDAEWLPG